MEQPHAVIRTHLENSEESMLDSLQSTQSVNYTCSTLWYTFSIGSKSEESEADLIFFADGMYGALGYPLSVNINFLPCPDFPCLHLGVRRDYRNTQTVVTLTTQVSLAMVTFGWDITTSHTN